MKTLRVLRETFVTNWSYKTNEGETREGTQDNQLLKLVDENGKIITETVTEIFNNDQIKNKIGWVVLREDGTILEKGWTVNEKHLSKKWFWEYVKTGKYTLLIGKL